MAVTEEMGKRAADRIMARIDKALLVRSLLKLNRRLLGRPGLERYFAQRFPVEVELLRDFQGVNLANIEAKTGNVSSPDAESLALHRISQETLSRISSSMQSMYEFAYANEWVRARLSPKAQVVFDGRLKAGLNDSETGLSSLSFELDTLNALTYDGSRVGFNDLELAGRGDTAKKFDFLIFSKGDYLEVECKSIDIDKGRKIRQIAFQRLLDWASVFFAQIEETWESGEYQAFLVDVVVEDRIDLSDQSQSAFNEGFRLCVSSRSSQRIRGYRFNYYPIADEILDEFQPFYEPLHAEVEKQEQIRNILLSHELPADGYWSGAWVQGRHFIGISCHSAAMDSVTDTVAKSIKDDAKGQLTGNQMGLLYVSLIGATTANIRAMRTVEPGQVDARTGICPHRLSQRVFSSASTRHLAGIRLSAGTYDVIQNEDPEGSFYKRREVLDLWNPHHRAPTTGFLLPQYQLHSPDWETPGY